MRVMVIVKASEKSEAGAMPSEALLTAMGAYNEALAEAGVLESGEGLLPSARGKRVAIAPEGRSVSDGPFSATSELAAGFYIWKVRSMDEALRWAERCPAPMPGEATTLELRPIASANDFGEGLTPDLRRQEERLRAKLESSHKPKVRTCLWFDGAAPEAAEFYVSLLPDSAIQSVWSPDPDKPAMVVELSLAGTPYMLLNAGPRYAQTPAASIVVRTADQAETDRLWDALTADGGEESRCAWLKDRFGVSWQIVPDALPRMLAADDRAAAARAMQAMLEMSKIDIAAIEAAFRGEEHR